MMQVSEWEHASAAETHLDHVTLISRIMQFDKNSGGVWRHVPVESAEILQKLRDCLIVLKGLVSDLPRPHGQLCTYPRISVVFQIRRLQSSRRFRKETRCDFEKE